MVGARGAVPSVVSGDVKDSGGDTIYTAFVKAPLILSTPISPPQFNGTRLQPLSLRVWARLTISLLKESQDSRSR